MPRTATLWSSTLLLLFVALLLYLYAPGLFGNHSPVFADSIAHGLPLFDFHSRILHEQLPALWTDKVYGGHPIHAEGQAALAHPLNIIIAWFFDPLLGQNVYHFICLLLSGLGMYGLCRCLGCSRLAAVFSMFAVAFSIFWLKTQANITVAGAITWIPWVLWAQEYWYHRPSLRSGALFGLATALIILAGYPHVFHGTLVFMAVRLLGEFVSKEGIYAFAQQKRAILTTGALAMLVCAALSAVQWLPLLELVSYSHRQGGINFANPFPAESIYRGLIYSLLPAKVTTPFAPSVGSLLVCALASLSLLLKLPLRGKCYIPATLVLLQLGMGSESPLFQLIYEYHLLPGMHFFRIMFVYFFLAVVGLAILAAFSLDSLNNRFALATTFLPPRLVAPAAVALGLFWLWTCVHLHTADVPSLQYAVVVLLAAGWWWCRRRGKLWLVPTLAVILIAVECAALRTRPFKFVDNQLLQKPASVQALETADDKLRDFKLTNTTASNAYTFLHPLSPDIEHGVQTMLESVAASSNMLWDIASPKGTFGLPMARQVLIAETVMSELRGEAPAAPGARIIDFLGYRYIATVKPFPAKGLKTVYRNRELNVLLQLNLHALPTIHSYSNAVFVDGAEQALNTMQQLHSPNLVVEATGELPAQTGAMQIRVERSTADYYKLTVDAPQGGWLFISDAWYPGWQASVDEVPTVVYPAQVLGKAVYVLPGAKTVKVWFKSSTFQWGLCISLAGLLLLIGLLVWPSLQSLPCVAPPP